MKELFHYLVISKYN